MQIVEILSADQLELFRNIERRWRELLKKGIFYAEGEQVVAALLRSRVDIFTILITSKLLEQYRSLMNGRNVQVFVTDKSSMERITQRRLNQGLVALGRIPESPPLETFFSEDGCIVALNAIDHAVNVGSIVRNCAAFNVDAIVCDEATIDPYCWRAIKSSIGAIFSLPIYSTSEFVSTLKSAQSKGFELIVAEPSATTTVNRLKPASKVCLIFGNEHKGVSPDVLDLKPKRISIPVQNVDSLNVASASAIFLHHISILTGNYDH